ncbi:hypothetical protein GF322_00990, partial [Candidatus Dependentiae bacterium]|nr:hypothetical protein [Candidatus Dependentiae bacterium]
MFNIKKFALALAVTFSIMFLLKKIFILLIAMAGFMPKCALIMGRAGMVGSDEMMMVYEKGVIGFGCTASWLGLFMGLIWFFVVGYVAGWIFAWSYNR